MVVYAQMRQAASFACLSLLLLALTTVRLQAQKGGGQNSAASQAATPAAAPAGGGSSGSPSSASLQGISYSHDSWREISVLPPPLNVTSATGTAINSQRGFGLNPSLVRPRMALLSGQTFPCNTDDHTFYPYTVAGSPLRSAFCPNEPPLPMTRPGRVDLPDPATRPPDPLVDDPKIVYLTWPVPLTADTLPTISMSLIYTPVAPALPWRADTFYPAGSIVLSTAGDQTNGHYYMALSGVTTPPTPEPDFNDGVVEVPRFADGGPGLAWRKIGPACTTSGPQPGGAGGGAQPVSPLPVDGLPVWTPGATYQDGQLILPPMLNCHYYRAVVTPRDGSAPTGSDVPPFTTDGKAIVDPKYVDPKHPNPNPDLQWQDMGTINIPTWAPNTAYAADAYITPSPANGYYYQALSAGVSRRLRTRLPPRRQRSRSRILRPGLARRRRRGHPAHFHQGAQALGSFYPVHPRRRPLRPRHRPLLPRHRAGHLRPSSPRLRRACTPGRRRRQTPLAGHRNHSPGQRCARHPARRSDRQPAQPHPAPGPLARLVQHRLRHGRQFAAAYQPHQHRRNRRPRHQSGQHRVRGGLSARRYQLHVLHPVQRKPPDRPRPRTYRLRTPPARRGAAVPPAGPHPRTRLQSLPACPHHQLPRRPYQRVLPAKPADRLWRKPGGTRINPKSAYVNIGTTASPNLVYTTTEKKLTYGGFVGFTLNITGLINAVAGVIP
jgi:hypothetical protein